MHVWGKKKQKTRCAHFNCDIYFSPDRPAFLPPDNQIHLRRYGCDEVTRVIYGLATWVKAVCMLGSLGEFTKAYVTLPASGDTVAFPADKLAGAEAQRAFCAIQLPWKKRPTLAKMLKQSRGRVQLYYSSERKYCCCAAKLTRLF